MHKLPNAIVHAVSGSQGQIARKNESLLLFLAFTPFGRWSNFGISEKSGMVWLWNKEIWWRCRWESESRSRRSRGPIDCFLSTKPNTFTSTVSKYWNKLADPLAFTLPVTHNHTTRTHTEKPIKTPAAWLSLHSFSLSSFPCRGSIPYLCAFSSPTQ